MATKPPPAPEPIPAEPSQILDLAAGHRLPAPLEHSASADAAFHAGLQDAPCYDREAINPEQPLRYDRESAHGLGRVLEARINEVGHQLEAQYDIVKDRRAEERSAEVRVEQARARREAAADAVAGRLDALRAEHPDIEDTTRPRPVGQRGRTPVDISFWVLLIGFAAAETVVNYLAMLYLREEDWITAALAVSVSLGLLGVAYYLAKTKAFRASPEALVAAAAALMVIIGTGALRFGYARASILAGLKDNAEQGDPAPTLLGAMTAALLAFSFGLPLLFGAISYLKTRGSTFGLTTGVRLLREDLLVAEELLAQVEEGFVAAHGRRLNAEGAVLTLIEQTESMIRTDAAARIELHSAYYRGLAHGLQDPAVTARLDRRFDRAHTEAASIIEKAQEEAVGRVRELADRAQHRLMRDQTPVTP